MKKTALAPLLLIAALASSCSYYDIRPPAPENLPRSASALPLRVGVSWKLPQAWKAYPPDVMSAADQNDHCLKTAGADASAVCKKEMDDWFVQYGWDPEYHKFGDYFAQALKASNLFQSVVFPLPGGAAAQDGVDLVISLKTTDQKFTNEQPPLFPGFFPGFLPLCDPFLIGCPFLNMTDTFTHGADMIVRDPSGREIKSYSKQVKVVASYPLFNSFGVPTSVGSVIPPDKDGSVSADQNLVSDLIQALISDRGAFQRFAGPSAGPEQAPPPQQQQQPPASGAQKPWWGH